MEFRRVRVGAFGRLRELDTGETPLPRLVVVQGSNEAGKSTFFQFLTTLLYGFYPASRETHPYAPWGGPDATGDAHIALADGTLLEVERRLLSTPAGSLSLNGKHEDLRNRTLPCAEHVPPGVFRQVFALTLAELARLEGESWARVQDRLVAGMGAGDLASVRDTVADLQREAGELWRPNRRGNQKVRALQERHRELRLRRRTAAEGDRRLREAAAERERVRAELAEARRERERCRVSLERAQALRPLRDRLRHLDELEAEAGDPADLADLPADPAGRRAELRTRRHTLEARIEELEAATVEPRERAAGPDAGGRALLDRRADVRDLVARVAGGEPERVRLGQLKQEMRDLERRAESAAAGIFAEPWPIPEPERLRTVPVGELRSAVDRHARAAETLRVLEATAPEKSDARPGRTNSRVGALLGAAGAVGLVSGLLGFGPLWGVAGALLLGMGGALLAVDVQHGRGDRGRAADRARALERARSAEEEARSAVAAALGELPLHPRVAREPSPGLAEVVERLQEIQRDRDDRAGARDAMVRRLETVREEIRILGAAAGLEVPLHAGAAAHLLDRRLREAEAAVQAAATARRELERLERERERAGDELRTVAEEEARLEERLGRLGDGDPAAGEGAARRRLRARDRAEQVREELARGPHGLEEARRRVAEAERDDAGPTDDADLARRRAREEELSQRVEELSRRLEGLEKDVTYLRTEESVDAVEGEIMAVEETLDGLTRERDRRWVLAAILREADRRFREEHQPDVLRQAGRHLSAITGGRYRRILLGEDRDGTFLLRGPDYPAPVEVGEPVSTGTREQVYLSLRLALLDHLDGSGERLPVFMDEAFVNWDEARRERTFALLEEVARTRQVFVFTCHDAMARGLEGRGARRLRLTGPDGRGA